MKTKLTALFVCLAMCFSMLTACGSGSTASGEAAAASSAAQSTAASASAEASTAAETSAAAEASPAASTSEEQDEVETAEVGLSDAEVPEAAPPIDPKAPPVRVGMLTILNMTEKEAAEMVRARKLVTTQLVKEGTCTNNVALNESNSQITVTFYDNLEPMLMALNAGQIDTISVSESVADYLVKTNGLVKPISHNPSAKHSEFASLMEEALIDEGYSFMMMKDHKALRKEFNKALDAMKKDGTLDRLIKEQITDVMKGKDPVEIELPPIPGAKTIEVAVTGALPPMDYVGPVGMPVGFSTAVLAEISTRIHKNISVSVIDSSARASALASGKVDVVFWTRTCTAASKLLDMSADERKAATKGMTKEEIKVIQQVDAVFKDAGLDFAKYASRDMPEGTIVTHPYYSGMNLPVKMK